jgi:hypothetical protein
MFKPNRRAKPTKSTVYGTTAKELRVIDRIEDRCCRNSRR